MEDIDRLNAEWVSLNAFRGLNKIATQGDMRKSSYDNALHLGGEVYPELLGDEVSLLKRERESDLTKEYRQKAQYSSIRDKVTINALDLVVKDLEEYEGLLAIAKGQKDNQKIDQIKNKVSNLNRARNELDPSSHTENQLIFRDTYNAGRSIPSLDSGQAYRDFELPSGRVLRLRVLHPDKVEHISGADLLYERHNLDTETVAIVAVQYKVWDDKKMYLSDPRMLEQIAKMKKFLCDKNTCDLKTGSEEYRFPCCSAFLRPTDKLQRADQKFASTGEHLPICKIDQCTSTGARGGRMLEYENIRDVSLSNETFEFLFNRGKIGSREMTHDELEKLYSGYLENKLENSVTIYAQEYESK